MNEDQAYSILRSVLAFFGGIAVSKGFLTSESLVLLTGLGLSVFPVVWGVMKHTTAAKIEAVEKMPEVKQIVIISTANGILQQMAADTNHKIVKEGDQ
jgi:ribosomal protein S8